MASLIQVLGPNRTGTTMTHLMLGNAKNAFACGELYGYYRPWFSFHFKPGCTCGYNYSNCIWKNFEHVKENRFYSDLVENHNVQWVVDESKRLRWIVDSQRWAKNNHLKIFNIVMVKKPINLMFSHWKRGIPISRTSEIYKEYYGRFMDLDLPFITVNVEDLTISPHTKLEKICNIIGMEYFEGKERFWEKRHCHLFGSLGLRKQMEKGTMEIRQEPKHPEKFLRMAKSEIEFFESDQKLLQIQRSLMQHEVDNATAYNGTPCSIRKISLPLWYYKDLLLSLYRKRFPLEWACS